MKEVKLNNVVMGLDYFLPLAGQVILLPNPAKIQYKGELGRASHPEPPEEKGCGY